VVQDFKMMLIILDMISQNL